MSDFMIFKNALHAQLTEMSKSTLFRTNTGMSVLWDTYLGSFKEGTDPIFRERTVHDCQCCRQFIRSAGNIVTIQFNELVTIWDVQVGGIFQVVADAMSALVKSNSVAHPLLHYQRDLGTDHNHEQLDNGDVKTWEHFHFQLGRRFVASDIGTKLSGFISTKSVFKRGLEEISIESLETVLELIDQNSLYKGDENRKSVQWFLTHKYEYQQIIDQQKDNYCWSKSVKSAGSARMRNTSMGTLLVDLSEGMELDQAVRKYEKMVAPENYKRSSALITKGMIEKAQKKISELGVGDALSRRYAYSEDLTRNNVLYADRSVTWSNNVFDEMIGEVTQDVSKLKKVEEVSVDTFIEAILPKAESLEVYFDNRHTSNLVSLIAPLNKDAKNLFKWDNNFSWSYNGEVTDSIKERVKSAGGNVDAVLRCSLSWFNYDDLDIHVIEPDGNRIWFSQPRSLSSGFLDIDMNDTKINATRKAVENIAWKNAGLMQSGNYKLIVKNYAKREDIDFGFDAEIVFGGETHHFNYPKKVRNGEPVEVAVFNYSKEGELKIISSIDSTQATKVQWGINTQKFHKVSMVMNSPNHWDGKKTGNKHLFFMLTGCKNEKQSRGFYNEFLNDDLIQHRKVFEVMSSKMKTPLSDNQLSGIGFSSTKRNSLLCKVTGSFTRTIRILF